MIQLLARSAIMFSHPERNFQGELLSQPMRMFLDFHVDTITELIMVEDSVDPIEQFAMVLIEFVGHGYWQKAGLLLRKAEQKGIEKEKLSAKVLEMSGMSQEIWNFILHNQPFDLPQSPAQFRHAKATRNFRFSVPES